MKRKFSPSFSSFVIRYGTAIFFVGAALTVTLFIWEFVKPLASPLFLVAIMVTAWKRGFGAGIFATVMSGFIIDYFFIAPQFQLSGNSDDFIRLLIFTFEGIVLCRLITWRTESAEEIRKSREQLQSLSRREQNLREDERKRIALEIHDELGQALTGLKMGIHLLNRRIKDAEHPEAESINDGINDLLHLADNTISSVRRIATELRPPILDDLGLVAAIEWQSQEFERRTEIPCLLLTNTENIELNSELATAIFRIFQETLTNIMRHAKANTIEVNLKKLNGNLILRVEDDGTGIQIDNLNSNSSLGILGMRERARLIGGELEFFSGEVNGTVVLLTAPIN